MNCERTLLSPRAAAAHLALAVQTLARWRTEGGGPPFFKIGGAIRYDTRDLDTWLNAKRRNHTAPARSQSAA